VAVTFRTFPAIRGLREDIQTTGRTRQSEQSARAWKILSLFQTGASAQKEISEHEERDSHQREK